jgi:hypothetical protein
MLTRGSDISISEGSNCMTEQIDTLLEILMGIPNAWRDTALKMAHLIAEMAPDERDELARTVARVERYRHKRRAPKIQNNAPIKRPKRGRPPKAVSEMAVA